MEGQEKEEEGAWWRQWCYTECSLLLVLNVLCGNALGAECLGYCVSSGINHIGYYDVLVLNASVPNSMLSSLSTHVMSKRKEQ